MRRGGVSFLIGLLNRSVPDIEVNVNGMAAQRCKRHEEEIALINSKKKYIEFSATNVTKKLDHNMKGIK